MLYLTKYKANKFWIFDTKDYTELCCDNKQIIEILKKSIEIVGLHLDWSIPTGIHVSPMYTKETDIMYYQGLELIRTKNKDLVALQYKTKTDLLSKYYTIIFYYKSNKVLTLNNVELGDIKTFNWNNRTYMCFIMCGTQKSSLDVNLKLFELHDNGATYCTFPFYLTEKHIHTGCDSVRYKICTPVTVLSRERSGNARIIYNKIFNRYYCYKPEAVKTGGVKTTWYQLVNIRNELAWANTDALPIHSFDYDLKEIRGTEPKENEIKVVLAPLLAKYNSMFKDALKLALREYKGLIIRAYPTGKQAAIALACELCNYEAHSLRKQLTEKLSVMNVQLFFMTDTNFSGDVVKYTVYVETAVLEKGRVEPLFIAEFTNEDLEALSC